MDTGDDISESVPTGSVIRDSTYQPKMCQSMWFYNENTNDPKTSGRYLLSQADYFYYQKKWDEAITVYKKAMPENMDRNTSLLVRIILESVSRCYLHKGDVDSALEWAVKLLKHSQSCEHKVIAHDLLSRICNQAGKTSEEAEHVMFCLLRQPLNGYHWMQLGHSYVYKALEGSGKNFEFDHLKMILPTTLCSKDRIEHDDVARQNGEDSIPLPEKLASGLKDLHLQNKPSVNYSKTTFKKKPGKAINDSDHEESDNNFVRISNQSVISETASQLENDSLKSVNKVVQRNEHEFTGRGKEGSDMEKNLSVISKENIGVICEDLKGSSLEQANSNSCTNGQGEKSPVDPMKFALICYIRARMLFKPNIQSSASLCNNHNKNLLQQMEHKIHSLGFNQDFITQVENLCWKRQFGIGKGEELEKISDMDSSVNCMQRGFEKYWFTGLMNQAALTTSE